METEMILRVAAIVVASVLLFSNISWSYVFGKVKNMFSFNFFKNKKVVIEEDEVADKPFLDIVDLWYSLKEKCTEEGLDQAVEKLDEVFPLFNAEK
tara:strand:- start:81 stop:368 length:288 start_codon:yes stop_codon:yes gene_type:complete